MERHVTGAKTGYVFDGKYYVYTSYMHDIYCVYTMYIKEFETEYPLYMSCISQVNFLDMHDIYHVYTMYIKEF